MRELKSKSPRMKVLLVKATHDNWKHHSLFYNPSHPYTLPSRTKRQTHDQNLSKSMAAPMHEQTAENKARKHNIVYSAFGG